MSPSNFLDDFKHQGHGVMVTILLTVERYCL
jgi:hypothetical protein